MRQTLGLGVAALGVALGGCKDLGVRGAANVPLDVARTRPAVFWAYQGVNPQQRKPYEGRTGDIFAVGAQRFIVQFPDFAGPPSMLAPVASQAGAPVYALRWAEPPFDQLYVAAAPNRLQPAPEIWQ